MTEGAPARPATSSERASGHLEREAEARVKVVVEGHDETSARSVDVQPWCVVAEETLRDEGVTSGRLDLIFVDEDAMAKLNREHLGHDRPTDVLAFPLDGPAVAASGNENEPHPVNGPPSHLGDIVVCWQVAADQASRHAGTVEAEVTLLVVHGVLHVLGHDHGEPAETTVMQAHERCHLRRHGFDHPVAV